MKALCVLHVMYTGTNTGARLFENNAFRQHDKQFNGAHKFNEAHKSNAHAHSDVT